MSGRHIFTQWNEDNLQRLSQIHGEDFEVVKILIAVRTLGRCRMVPGYRIGSAPLSQAHPSFSNAVYVSSGTSPSQVS